MSFIYSGTKITAVRKKNVYHKKKTTKTKTKSERKTKAKKKFEAGKCKSPLI